MTSARWTTACPDWAERIVAGDSLVACAPLYPDRAAEALGIFKSLRLTDQPRKRDGTWPTLGELCEPFVFDLVAALFGSQDPLTGESRIKEAFLLISKKNGKSTIAAGVMLTALILNWRDEAELLVLAPTLEIANNCFGPAAAMVRADPELSVMLSVHDHLRVIKHIEKNAELKIVAADAGVVGGKKAGFVLIDELWLFGKKNGADAMLEEATGGQASRPEGFTIYLSTHSDDLPAGVFKSKLAYFRDVRDGRFEDNTCLPMLYEWPEAMLASEAYLDPANFYVTNPNLGKSQTEQFITRKIAQAQAGEGTDGDSTLQIVLAKYLNVEIGQRLRRDRWAGADGWIKGADESLTLQSLLDRSDVVVAGIDGGGLGDLFGFAALGRERGTGDWLAWIKGWATEQALRKHKQIAPLLRGFAADGDLVLVDSGSEILRQAAAMAWRVRQSGKMPDKHAVAVDVGGMALLSDALVDAGFDPGDQSLAREGEIVAVRQGGYLSSALHALDFKLGDATFWHPGSDFMAWCVGNVLVKLRGSYLYADKELSGAGKIDPFIALLNAAKVMETGPVAGGAGPSIYTKREMVFI